MIQLVLSNEEFQYDIYSLVKAFYPKEQIRLVTKEDLEENDFLQLHLQLDPNGIHLNILKGNDEVVSKWESGDIAKKSEYKNIIKRLIYLGLSSITGKELPWGTLTGVRPQMKLRTLWVGNIYVQKKRLPLACKWRNGN
ncbi:MAG: hemZ [Anaerocolumna sp.]|nr:hemZ [Anaerocolumna sp.]